MPELASSPPVSKLSMVVLRFTLAFVAVFVVAELGVRTIDGRLPDPVEWHYPDAKLKIDGIQLVRPSVLIAGTSQSVHGIDPAVLNAQLGNDVTAFNGALPSGHPLLQESWLAEELVSRSKPSVVVWGVGPIVDLHWTDDTVLDKYEAAHSTKPGVLGVAQRWLGDRLALIEHRPSLRDPHDVWNVAFGDPLASRHVSNLDLLGYRSTFEVTLDTRFGPARVDRIRVLDTGFKPKQAQALDRTVEALHDQGITVVLVEMPVSTDALEYSAKTQQEHDRGSAEIALIAANAGVSHLVSPERFQSNDLYVDFTHFNAEGGQQFSTWLAGELEPLLEE